MEHWCACAASANPIHACFDIEISDNNAGRCLGATQVSDPRDCQVQQIATRACLPCLVCLVQTRDFNGVLEWQVTELRFSV